MPVNVIAIDGPSASGKSTVARRVAAALGWIYVDSGAVYRGITWRVMALGVAPGDMAGAVAALRGMAVESGVVEQAVKFTYDGRDPGGAIRTAPVAERVSEIAAIPEIRVAVTAWLRETTRFGPVVMEGRDIGSVVFPDARHKFYLDADPRERARRRAAEGQGEDGEVKRVLGAITRRDARDSGRATAPLRVASGAIVLDTTGLGIEQVTERILDTVKNA
ncbi:MAG: (d)CMP kinase [bacterium]